MSFILKVRLLEKIDGGMFMSGQVRKRRIVRALELPGEQVRNEGLASRRAEQQVGLGGYP
jgi:hypothetical protein